jgi:RNA polymerase sigma-70 factor (ECF subfamily)
LGNEAKLIAAAKRGDGTSLAELLQHNYKLLYQYALKLTMDRSRAEDLVQETMLKAIERISTFQERSKFSTWLIAISSRLAIDKARRRKREERWLKEEVNNHRLRFDTLSLMEEWPAALQALGNLEEHHRMPVLLKYYYGYSQEEIAEMLEIRLGTVKSRLSIGMKLIRKELGEHE